MYKFKVGDKVTRPVDVFENNGLMLTGIVCHGPYCRGYKYLGWYPELYDVLWEQKPKISKGYFCYGLEHASTNP